jgi:putative membrane protein
MELLISFLILFVAFEHFVFLYLEMFLWTKDIGRKVFGNSKEEAEKTKILAANQGLYNGFISAGLVWGFFHTNAEFGFQIILFFLACVIVAGVYGAVTAKTSILYLQAFPALLTMALILLS